MVDEYSTARTTKIVKQVVHNAAFWGAVALTGSVIYFSEMPVGTSAFLPLYYQKILGLDILDYLTFGLMALTIAFILVEQKIVVTKFHRYLFVVLFIYGVAMINGFVYGRVFQYPLKRWVQDIQQVSYLFTYFVIVFAVCDAAHRWRLFFRLIIVFAFVKNLSVTLDLLRERGVQLLRTTIISARGADAVLLSVMFYPVFTYLVWKEEKPIRKLLYLIPIFVFILNILASVGRTVWLLLIVSLGYFLVEARLKRGVKILFIVILAIVLLTTYLQMKYPKFIDFARWRLTSIINLSISQENLSNATRVIEIKNIFHRLFNYASLIQGMGLGAWWDDRYITLPPGDVASGFIGEKRFFHTHLWSLTQLLKIGLIGTAIYWIVILKMLAITRRRFAQLESPNPYKLELLALNIIFFNLALCGAGFLRIFICMGVVLALIARGLYYSERHEG
jgi:hypothetical protein